MGYMKLLMCLALFVYTIQATAVTEEQKVEDALKTIANEEYQQVEDPSGYKNCVRCWKVKKCSGYGYYKKCSSHNVCRNVCKKRGYGDESEDTETDKSDPSGYKKCVRCWKVKKCSGYGYYKKCWYQNVCRNVCERRGSYGDESEDAQTEESDPTDYYPNNGYKYNGYKNCQKCWKTKKCSGYGYKKTCWLQETCRNVCKKHGYGDESVDMQAQKNDPSYAKKCWKKCRKVHQCSGNGYYKKCSYVWKCYQVCNRGY